MPQTNLGSYQKINFTWPCLLFRKQVPIAPGMKLTLLLGAIGSEGRQNSAGR
jgi:hypothetical protein